MIEIIGKLVGGSAYLPGDNIICCITITNDDKGQGNVKINAENLAWASAQIHCICSSNSKLPLPKTETKLSHTTSSDTSFLPYGSDAPGRVVFCTKPKILFCDLVLPSGTSKSFIYSESIPNEAPPSYRGQLIKYSYKITIGAQRVNCPIKLLRIPIRILSISGVQDNSITEDSEDLSPSNPFLESKDNECELGPALQLMHNITSRRNPNFYNITNPTGKVGRFCLFKQAYRLGEDIVGTFDFTKSVVHCMQFTVTLQCDEVITTPQQKKETVSYSKFHEVCLNMKHCHLNLPIPLYITPAFTTDLVTLVWKLHFEFVIIQPGSMDAPANGAVWQAPLSLNIETMVWDLPIQVYPTIAAPDPQSRIPHRIVF